MIFNTHYSSKATKDLTGRIYRTLGMKNTKRTIKMIRKMMKLIPTGKKVVIEATADRCSFEVVNNTMNPFVEGVTDLVTGCDKVFINDKYQVFCKTIASDRNGFGKNILWLSIKTHERTHEHDWRDLQRIKNELAGSACEAIEIYPAVERLVDTSNQYHLWCFPPDVRIPTGYQERDVFEDQASFDKEFGRSNARQRNMEECHKKKFPAVGKAWS